MNSRANYHSTKMILPSDSTPQPESLKSGSRDGDLTRTRGRREFLGFCWMRLLRLRAEDFLLFRMYCRMKILVLGKSELDPERSCEGFLNRGRARLQFQGPCILLDSYKAYTLFPESQNPHWKSKRSTYTVEARIMQWQPHDKNKTANH